MSPLIARLAPCLFLSLLLNGCELRSVKPLVCNPKAMMRCERLNIDMPETTPAGDQVAAIAEVAVLALVACSIRHAELLKCLEKAE